MLDTDPPFRPIRRRDGYLALEDMGLIGDGTTAAPPELPAYGRILLDVLRGEATLSIRADEAEEAWRIVTSVLEGWSRNLTPLEEYDAGSHGP